MRYSDRISFVTETEEVYNPRTGEYEGGVFASEVYPCKTSTLGIDRTINLFGQLDINIVVARLQRPFNSAYTYVEINDKRLNVKRHIPHSSGSVFYLEGSVL